MEHEYLTRNGNIVRRHNNGARLGKPGRLSPWETAELCMDGNDSIFWESRAKAAMDAMTLDFRIDDELFNAFNDRVNLIANSLTWKRLYEIWQAAYQAWQANPSISLVDLVRETLGDLA